MSQYDFMLKIVRPAAAMNQVAWEMGEHVYTGANRGLQEPVIEGVERVRGPVFQQILAMINPISEPLFIE